MNSKNTLKSFVVLFLLTLLLVIPTTATLSSGLLSYWSFDTDAKDDYDNHNGTAYGLLHGNTGCILNNCYFFEGADNRSEIADHSELRLAQNFSISAWFNWTTDNNDYNMIVAYMISSSGSYTEDHFYMGVRGASDHKLVFQLQLTDGAQLATSTNAIQLNTLYHAVAVFNETHALIYLNGELNNTLDLGGTKQVQTGAGATFMIGANDKVGVPADNKFNGYIDEVGYWHRCLNETEVAALWNNSYGYNPSNETQEDTSPPTWIQGPTNQDVDYDTAFSYDISASDPSGIDTYSLNDSTYFQINSATGLITNSTGLTVGTYYHLTVSVNDTLGYIQNGTMWVLQNPNWVNASATIYSKNSGTRWSASRIPTMQRSSFYANNRYWIFLSNYTDMYFYYTSSPNGVTWDDLTRIAPFAQHTARWAIYYDSTHTYYTRTYSNVTASGSGMAFRRGTPQSNGIISWEDEHEAIAPTSRAGCGDQGFAVDSNGYAYFGSRKDTGANPFLHKNKNNTGGWQNATGYPILFENISSTNTKPTMAAMEDGKMYIVLHTWDRDIPVVGKYYNGTDFINESNITISFVKGSDGTGANLQRFQINSINDEVHIAFLTNSYEIRYRLRNSAGAWQDEVILDTVNVDIESNPQITLDIHGNVYVTWQDYTNNKIWMKRKINGVWDENTKEIATCSFEETFAHLISSRLAQNNKFQLVYLTNTYSIVHMVVNTGTTYEGDTTPPTWDQAITDQTVAYGDPLSYDVNASDPSGIDTYSLNDSTYFQINAATGLITNKTGFTNGTYYHLTVSVNDTGGYTQNATFWVFMDNPIVDNDPPVFSPALSNQAGYAGYPFTYTIYATDATGIDTISLNDTSNFTISLNGSYGDLARSATIINATNLTAGTYHLEIFINDTLGNSYQENIQIEISEYTPPDTTEGGIRLKLYVLLLSIFFILLTYSVAKGSRVMGLLAALFLLTLSVSLFMIGPNLLIQSGYSETQVVTGISTSITHTYDFEKIDITTYNLFLLLFGFFLLVRNGYSLVEEKDKQVFYR